MAAAVARPAGNTGTGFYVAGSKLYDANGNEFRVRGVNRVHYDSPGSPTSIAKSGANTERISLYFSRPVAGNLAIVNTQILANKIVPMPSNWNGTCSSDPAKLSAIVDTWVAQAPAWTTLNSNSLINVANEWGPGTGTAAAPNYGWRDGYLTAIARMRAAGYLQTLVIDAGSCGQSPNTVVRDGAALLAADPEHNLLFDVHVYGNFYFPATASWMQDYTTSMAALKASALPVMLGEFGPGKNIGPSPTMITPQQVIATAEANGWGWMPWAWDDNNLAGCQANDTWFAMTTNCGWYSGDAAGLTAFGQAIVPVMQAKAVKATIF